MANLAQQYTWQQPVWNQMMQMRERLPHALLLHGQTGTGKLDFAKALSKALLCKTQTPEGHVCGHCSSCHWFDDESHPDFKMLTPEDGSNGDETTSKKKVKKKQNISIAQVRALSDFVNLTSHNEKGMRIILIQPAETLNIASANALLKMLEEPSENAMFILVSHQLQRLLPTILSRCHKVMMPTPTSTQAIDWLESQGVTQAQAQLRYYGDSPLQVVNEASNFPNLEESWRLLAQGNQLNPSLLVSKLVSPSVENGIITLQKWLYDIVVFKNTRQVHYHSTQRNALEKLASKVNLQALFDLQKKIESLRKLATHPLNHELQLECLLLEYTKIFSVK